MSAKDDDKALQKLAVSMTGASADPHDIEPPGVEAKSVQAGHEPDRFGVKGILIVPLFVVVALVAAYLTITGTFKAIVKPAKFDPATMDAGGAALNEFPINQRFGRTSSTDPIALPKLPDTAVPQPRLEYLKETAKFPSDPPVDPPFMRSKQPDPFAPNTPEITPQDLKPANFVDPTTHLKLLVTSDWVKKGEIARLPIDQVIGLIASDSHTKSEALSGKTLGVRKEPVARADTSDARAKSSNGGRPTATPVAETKKDQDHKH